MLDSCQSRELRTMRSALKNHRQQLLQLSSSQLDSGSFPDRYFLSGCDVYPLWYVAAVITYIKETGDFEILEERRCFSGEQHAVAIHLHLRVAFELLYQSVKVLDPFSWDKMSNIGNSLAVYLFLSISNEYIELCRFAELRNEAVLARIIRKQAFMLRQPVYSRSEWLQYARASLHKKVCGCDSSDASGDCRCNEIQRFIRIYLLGMLTLNRNSGPCRGSRISNSYGGCRIPVSPTWNCKAVSEWLLGIKPGFEGLFIEPGIRKNCKDLKIKRYFRNAAYDICILNTLKTPTEVKRLIVDGSEYLGNLLPNFSDGKVHTVEVTMGTFE